MNNAEACPAMCYIAAKGARAHHLQLGIQQFYRDIDNPQKTRERVPITNN